MCGGHSSAQPGGVRVFPFGRSVGVQALATADEILRSAVPERLKTDE